MDIVEMLKHRNAWFSITDECIDIPCENNGTCVDILDGYKCHCTPGFNGTNCTESEDFVTIVFQNNFLSKYLFFLFKKISIKWKIIHYCIFLNIKKIIDKPFRYEYNNERPKQNFSKKTYFMKT
jgi:hypothetical protein